MADILLRFVQPFLICSDTYLVHQCKLSSIPVLGNDIQQLAVLVLCVGIDNEVARKSATDGELETGGNRPALANGSNGPSARPTSTPTPPILQQV